jgi:hypothetical protein
VLGVVGQTGLGARLSVSNNISPSRLEPLFAKSGKIVAIMSGRSNRHTVSIIDQWNYRQHRASMHSDTKAVLATVLYQQMAEQMKASNNQTPSKAVLQVTSTTLFVRTGSSKGMLLQLKKN